MYSAAKFSYFYMYANSYYYYSYVCNYGLGSSVPLGSRINHARYNYTHSNDNQLQVPYFTG